MTSWQDVMIEKFGKNWLKEKYEITDIGKLAEDLAEAIDFIKDTKTSFRECAKLKSRLKEAEGVIQLAIDESKCSCFPHSVMCVHCRLKGHMNKYRINNE